MAINQAETVGANVRAELARKRMSQEVLAEHLHLSQTAVSRRLNGRKAFDVNELATISAAVGVPMQALLASERAA